MKGLAEFCITSSDIGEHTLRKGKLGEWSIGENRRGPAAEGLRDEVPTVDVMTREGHEKTARCAVGAVVRRRMDGDVGTTHKAGSWE